MKIASFDFPYKGLDRSRAFNDQPVRSTASALNVMPYDVGFHGDFIDRARGGQRDGTLKFKDQQLAGGAQVMGLHQAATAYGGVPLIEEDFQYADGELDSPDWIVYQSNGTANSFDTSSDCFYTLYADPTPGAGQVESQQLVLRSTTLNRTNLAIYRSPASTIPEILTTDVYDVSVVMYGCWEDSVTRYLQGTPLSIVVKAPSNIGEITPNNPGILPMFGMVRIDFEQRPSTTARRRLRIYEHQGFSLGWQEIFTGPTENQDWPFPMTVVVRVMPGQVRVFINGTLWATATLTMPHNSNNTTFGFLSKPPYSSGTQAYSIWDVIRVEPVDTSQSNRRTWLCAVAGGNIYLGDADVNFQQVGTGLNAAILPTMTDGQGKIMVAAASGLKVVDLETATTTDYATTVGAIPNGNVTHVTIWRDRLCMVVDTDPHNLYCSRAGVYTDQDYNPAVPDAQQAFVLNASTAGRIGQPIKALIPFNDDILMMGCDHSIHTIEGDPADGGSVACLSQAVGIYGDRSWCMDPSGMVWFVGSGGLYRTNGQTIENVSEGRLDDVFTTIARNYNNVELEWDRDQHGCWIFITPAEATQAFHIWYDQRSDGFWMQQFPINHGPRSALVFDADDNNDRNLLLGCRDGYVRKLVPGALSDDGTAISSFLFVGPLNPYDRFGKFKLIETEFVLATEPSAAVNVSWSLRGGDDAQAALTNITPLASGTFTAGGRRQKVRLRSRANTMFMVLANSVVNKTWNIEKIHTIFQPSGRTR